MKGEKTMNRLNMIFGGFYILNIFHIPSDPITYDDIINLSNDDSQLADVMVLVTGDIKSVRDSIQDMPINEFKSEAYQNKIGCVEKGIRMIVNGFDDEIYRSLNSKKSSLLWNVTSRNQTIRILNYYMALFIDVIIPALKDEWKVER